ncbi:hypothetical protein BJF79_07440 [Actinomadura sp. CNU-125]|uniref:hypothetical protein n=1 Tax=Actinomadura sp. CNU-125 TaxID=1904961 RepID=UPI000965335F|nr:hypothetical protein [Actinomadura sp. CNU-125]OLT34392.1 hypothetical protein BJF79_07440 [Actinomadura sp. CNU-125]
MSRLQIPVEDLGPELIGYRLETTDTNGHRVGVRLARYEILTIDGEPIYHLIADPAPVIVKVRAGTPLTVAAQVPGTIPPTARPRAAGQNPGPPQHTVPPAPRTEVPQPQ